MRFSKWHALGNAYLVVEADRLDAERVVALCDPARGIGADGVVQVVSRAGATATVLIWNPDGSTAEMSGNGTRIAASWLALETGDDTVSIVTCGREVRARLHGGGVVETDVGRFAVGRTETVEVTGGPVELTSVSVGNPHAVVRVDELSHARLLELGPELERHDRFPGRTNVQLVRPSGSHDVEALVWERGAGETPSSGSSAVAVAAAAVARGWCESPVSVHMPGGDLRVAVEGDRAVLFGPAVRICVGEADDS